MAKLVLDSKEVSSMMLKTAELEGRSITSVAEEIEAEAIITEDGLEMELPVDICEMYDTLTPFIASEIQSIIEMMIDDLKTYKVSTKTMNYLENIFKVTVK